MRRPLKNDGCEEWIPIGNKKPESFLEDEINRFLLHNRVIILHGEINEENCNLVARKLLYLQLKKVKDVRIILNSVGGEVYHGLLLYNTLEEMKKQGTKVIVETRGLCASMAVIVLQGGDERIAAKYSRFLLHEVSSWAYGKASEVKEESEELEKVNTMLDEIIIKNSKMTLKELQKRTKKKDWWISALEALKYGIIDKVI